MSDWFKSYCQGYKHGIIGIYTNDYPDGSIEYINYHCGFIDSCYELGF